MDKKRTIYLFLLNVSICLIVALICYILLEDKINQSETNAKDYADSKNFEGLMNEITGTINGVTGETYPPHDSETDYS